MTRTYVTVRQRWLGQELRKLREKAGLTLDDAAKVLECTKAKVSRVEIGQNGIRPYELRGLLTTYGVTDREHADALAELAKQGSRRGWWNEYQRMLPRLADFAQLEANAKTLHAWQLSYVPGLLQTPDYMRAIFRSGRFADASRELEKSVESRLARQEVLEREDRPEFRAVVFEAVLQVQVGGAQVMRRQWRHVADLMESGRITVQVMPYDAGAHRGLDGQFLIFGMPMRGMDLVLVDNAASPVYVEKDEDVQRFRDLFDGLRAAALGPAASLDLIRHAAGLS